MTVLIAPDKFRGSLTAAEVAAALARGLHEAAPDVTTVALPVADGGEGTVDAAVLAGFDRVAVIVSGPTGEAVHTSYARRGRTAVVELATVCGQPRLAGGVPAAMAASSYGVGEVVAAAIADGAARIVLGIGGSAGTDGGIGMLQALGAEVLDTAGAPVGRGGAALREVAELRLPGSLPCELVVACDVDNPLTGPQGAAAVFGPQKGASCVQVAELDAGLRQWAAVAARVTGVDHGAASGAGAAGGVGFAALLLGARMRAGSHVVLDLVDFAAHLRDADLVITGEGSLDAQTLAGKAPAGVAAAAGAAGVPVLAVAGRCTLSAAELTAAGIRQVYRLTDLEPDEQRSMAHAEALIVRIGRAIAADHVLVTR